MEEDKKNIIPAEIVRGQTKPVLPDASTLETPSLLKDTLATQGMNAQTELEQYQIQQEQAKKSDVGDLSKLMEDIGVIQAGEGKIAQGLGSEQALADINKYNKQLVSEQRALENKLRDLRGTVGGVSEETNALSRESLRKQADIAILKSASQGDYDTALQIAKSRVADEVAPMQAKLDALKFQYDQNKDMYSEAEKSKISLMLKREENKIDREEENKTVIEDMIINAMRNHASSSKIATARDLANKGAKKEDIVSLLGDYTISPEDKLSDEIKRLQKKQLEQETKAPTVKTINGVDMQWNPKTAQWEKAGEAGIVDIKKSEESLLNIQRLETVAKDAKELSYASGRGQLRQFVGKQLVGATKSAQLENLSNTIKVNILTMNTDPNIKKFFGPQMTERDTELMTGAGTTLNPDLQTPEQYKAEVDEILNMFDRAKKAVEEGLTEAKTQSYFDSTGQALEVTNNPITQAGYKTD